MELPIPAEAAAEAAETAPASEIAAEAAQSANPGTRQAAQAQAGPTFGDTGKTARQIWNGEGSQKDTITLMNAIERGEVRMDDLMPSEEAEAERETGGEGEAESEGAEASGEDPSAEGAEEDAPAAETEAPGKQPRRIKPAGSAEDRARIIAANDLMREEGIGFLEAIQRLGFVPAPAAEAAEARTETPTQNKPAEPKADPVKTARDKLAGLVRQKAEAAASFDHERVADIEMEIEDARMIYAEANRAVQARSSKAHEAQRAADAAAIAQVTKAVPEFNDPASPLAKAALRLEQVLEKGDPEFFTRTRPKGETWASELFRLSWAQAYPHKAMPSLNGTPVPTNGVPAKKTALPVPVLPKKNGAPALSMLGNGAQRTTEVNSLQHVFDDPHSTREQRIDAANRLEQAGRRR